MEVHQMVCGICDPCVKEDDGNYRCPWTGKYVNPSDLCNLPSTVLLEFVAAAIEEVAARFNPEDEVDLGQG